MIESISIAKAATFGSTPEILSDLSQLNFIYGSNGAGKTTISAIIADEGRYSECSVTWKGGRRLEAKVYNRDFVAKNFHQPADLSGIFTLGENSVVLLENIAEAKAELDKLSREGDALRYTLEAADGRGGKRADLLALEADFRKKCWKQKQKHDEAFSRAFDGCRNNAAKFMQRLLEESENNSASSVTLEILKERALTLFDATPASEALIPPLDWSALSALESDPILTKRVIGKADVDIAAMIQRLGNSDWVREGRGFYEVSATLCPFCQNTTTDALSRSLNAFFDETFEADAKAVDEIDIAYRAAATRFQGLIDSLLSSSPRFLDTTKLKAEKTLLDSILARNLQSLTVKRKEASTPVKLESLAGVSRAIQLLLTAANEKVRAHNKMVNNVAAERQDLTAKVWRYLIDAELKAEVEAYKSKHRDLSKAIAALTSQIKTKQDAAAVKKVELQVLEKSITSVQPSIDAINRLLSSFGFRGFSLASSDDSTRYKLVRADGSDAKDTLSEGEKTFVTFLYFYQLLKGSETESGMTIDRVVVFDDPVSSLDSDILFIVGSLIKSLFDDLRNSKGHIKQAFVLTHNVYFHKEITFNSRRGKVALGEETFWTVRKSGEVSRVEKHASNPIKTAYELLWAELQKVDHASITIQNTLRRILENYFKILGGVDPDSICSRFAGKERMICKSLFSWVNDGSHSAHDDLYVSTAESTIEIYLAVFRRIFENEGHLAHYRMMMGDAFVDSPSAERAA